MRQFVSDDVDPLDFGLADEKLKRLGHQLLSDFALEMGVSPAHG
jgi:hypothetical protein